MLSSDLSRVFSKSINEYRRLNNGKDPSPEKLQEALSKDFTEKKLVATTSDGVRYVYTPRMMSDNKIVSVNDIGNGRVSVTYRDSRDNPDNTRVVNMFVEQFAERTNLKPENSWLGNSKDLENNTTDLGLR